MNDRIMPVSCIFRELREFDSLILLYSLPPPIHPSSYNSHVGNPSFESFKVHDTSTIHDAM